MHPRVLIVGTVPYNVKSTSRAFDAYFHNWERENLAQIFSDTRTPCKGHCGRLYQITDYRMVQRWLHPGRETGVQYTYETLADAWQDNSLELKSDAAAQAYKLGRKHTPLTHLLRGILWRKRFWCTAQLLRWMDEFAPQCVFLSFSDDYFIPKIALFAAKRYHIPIVSSIGDDYYFNTRFSLNPAYLLYKSTYRALIRKVFAHLGSAIYISDKIRDKYNSVFALDGQTVYLTSELSRRAFREIDRTAPVIRYFGNIGMGRNESLCDIADALASLSQSWMLEVYSNQTDPRVCGILQQHPNIRFCGSVPYAEVLEKTAQSDIVVIVEGFKPKDVNLSRYSLSTKAADSLAGGTQILVYGSAECGVVEYMQSTHGAAVCTAREQLAGCIRQLIEDTALQKSNYEHAGLACRHHHLAASTETFEAVVGKAIGMYGKTKSGADTDHQHL